jgi:hypothetical protein
LENLIRAFAQPGRFPDDRLEHFYLRKSRNNLHVIEDGRAKARRAACFHQADVDIRAIVIVSVSTRVVQYSQNRQTPATASDRMRSLIEH